MFIILKSGLNSQYNCVSETLFFLSQTVTNSVDPYYTINVLKEILSALPIFRYVYVYSNLIGSTKCLVTIKMGKIVSVFTFLHS